MRDLMQVSSKLNGDIYIYISFLSLLCISSLLPLEGQFKTEVVTLPNSEYVFFCDCSDLCNNRHFLIKLNTIAVALCNIVKKQTNKKEMGITIFSDDQRARRPL